MSWKRLLGRYQVERLVRFLTAWAWRDEIERRYTVGEVTAWLAEYHGRYREMPMTLWIKIRRDKANRHLAA